MGCLGSQPNTKQEALHTAPAKPESLPTHYPSAPPKNLLPHHMVSHPHGAADPKPSSDIKEHQIHVQVPAEPLNLSGKPEWSNLEFQQLPSNTKSNGVNDSPINIIFSSQRNDNVTGLRDVHNYLENVQPIVEEPEQEGIDSRNVSKKLFTDFEHTDEKNRKSGFNSNVRDNNSGLEVVEKKEIPMEDLMIDSGEIPPHFCEEQVWDSSGFAIHLPVIQIPTTLAV